MSPVFYPPAASGGGGAVSVGSTPALKIKSGNWFGPYEIPGTGSYGGTLNRLDLVPMWVSQSTSVNAIAAMVTTAGAAGAVARMGIFNSKADGMPGTVLLDAGTVGTTSTGLKSITISQTLTAGLYYIATVPQVAVATFRAFGLDLFSRYGADWDNGYFESIGQDNDNYLTVAGVSGALSDLTSASFGFIGTDAIKTGLRTA